MQSASGGLSFVPQVRWCAQWSGWNTMEVRINIASSRAVALGSEHRMIAGQQAQPGGCGRSFG